MSNSPTPLANTPPVAEVLPDLLEALRQSNQVLLKAPTGAGKSTYLPKALLESGAVVGKIVLLEPRRLAAKNIALFLAKQLGEPIGQRVGYRVRGETKVSADTVIEVVTEAILTRMIQTDPELSGIGMVILDEFHERSIHADTALAFCLEIQAALRDDLALLVMSATLDEQSFTTLMPEAVFLQSQGKSYPVELQYAPVPHSRYWLPHVIQTIQRVHTQHQGVILVFLPSVAAIERVFSELSDDVSASTDVSVCRLHGRLPFAQQQQAIKADDSIKTKIVLTTNVAETSLTIEGVTLVIDSGLAREASFNLNTGITKLEEKWTNQSSAIQRAGRAGRLGPGQCIRLYSETQFNQMASNAVPEILRSDLSALALEMKVWGANEPSDLAWLTPPLATHWAHATALLKELGLLDSAHKPTELLATAHQFGSSPRIASMLLSAQQVAKNPRHDQVGQKLLHGAIWLAALLDEPIKQGVDIQAWVSLLAANRHPKQALMSKRIQQLSGLLCCALKGEPDPAYLGIALSFAFPDRVAKARSGSTNNQWQNYQLANGHGAQMRSDEKLTQQAYLVCADLITATQSASTITAAMGVDIDLLQTLRTDHFEKKSLAKWSDERGQLLAETQLCWGKLVVSRRANTSPDRQDIEQALLQYVTSKGLQVLAPTEQDLQLIERARCAAQWLNERTWPDFEPSSLLQAVDLWLAPYLTNIVNAKQLRSLSVSELLQAYLGWENMQLLNKELPTHLTTAAGSRKRLTYQFGKSPFLAVKMQEMFGESDSPSIAHGRVKVTLELLSPAQRPLQVTQDLAGFWLGAYNEVKKEMRGRYPKHVWPDEPQHHQATTKTKRQLNR
ncbi:ATP-dependent helicase HrpB [Vibrio sp. qd031]|uniref:ATP-dependent helicase HrpB n=1 Tax=Vibrio sp. qd031 TaxID=1603038 RepID=UPI000A101299|nr:ATP-dependent helicase HrpB [Vibrio sp. qd031]